MTATLQVLPSDLATEITEGLLGLAEHHGIVPGAPPVAGTDLGPLWEELGTGGWTELADPSVEEDGLSLLDLCAIAETWGRLLVPVPFLQTLAVRRWLPTALRPAGKEPLSYEFAEGEATLVAFGSQVAQIAGGSPRGDLVLWPNDYTGRGNGALVDDYAPSLPIAVSGSGQRAAPAEAVRGWATLCLGEAVGAAAQALDNATAYVSERRQFGRPVGSFQGLKHRFADMHTDVEMARSAVVWSCSEPSALDRAAPAVLDLCSSVAETAIHAHGGFGFTWECNAHWYLRHGGALSRVVSGLLSQEFSR